MGLVGANFISKSCVEKTQNKTFKKDLTGKRYKFMGK